jgi:hypothetical protein
MSSTGEFTSGPARRVSLVLASVMVLVVCVGCDSEPGGETSEAVSPTETSTQPGADDSAKKAEEDSSEHAEGEESEEHEHGEHEHDHAEGVHLADTMYELSRRYSAIWYAGELGNAKMLHYQAHEIEEMVAGLEEASPKENGIDVVTRLKSDVLEPIEKLETAVEEGDRDAFKDTYTAVMKNCEECHADTAHDYINVKKPEYNPYPNLDFRPENGE